MKIEEDSLISSVSGLNDSPRNRILFTLLVLTILKIFLAKLSLILSFVLITVSTILNFIFLSTS